MKLYDGGLTVLLLIGLLGYGASTVERATTEEGVTAKAVVAVVKSDVTKVKEELKKVTPSTDFVYND